MYRETMRTRLQAALVLLPLVWLTLPAAVCGQRSEGEDAETVRSPANATPSGVSPDLHQVAQLIVKKTNQFRQQKGRPKVEVDPKLTAAAEYFSRYMARTKRYVITEEEGQFRLQKG